MKIILLNAKNEVLLLSTDDSSIKTADGKYKGKFWQLVGGKIEPGETFLQAAKRELFEETGITENNVLFYTTIGHDEFDLEMNGTLTHIKQSYMVAKTNNDIVSFKNLTKEEIPVIKTFKWFSVDEIKNSTDSIYPIDLYKYLLKIKIS